MDDLPDADQHTDPPLDETTFSDDPYRCADSRVRARIRLLWDQRPDTTLVDLRTIDGPVDTRAENLASYSTGTLRDVVRETLRVLHDETLSATCRATLRAEVIDALVVLRRRAWAALEYDPTDTPYAVEVSDLDPTPDAVGDRDVSITGNETESETTDALSRQLQ